MIYFIKNLYCCLRSDTTTKATSLKIVVLIFALLTANAPASFCQEQKLRFERLGVEQGLADNTTISAMQDHLGYLWFATWNGLNKFDGYNFSTYQFDPFDSNSVGGNVIREVFEDKEGLIWVSAIGNNVYTFDRKTEKFTYFNPDSSFNFHSIITIVQDNNGDIWFGTSTGDVGRYDKGTGKFYSKGLVEKISANKDPKNGIQLSIWNLFRDSGGNIWIASTNGLLKAIIPSKSKRTSNDIDVIQFQHDPKNNNSLISDFVRCIYEDTGGNLWIGTADGLNSYNPKTGKFLLYQNDPGDSCSLSYNDVRTIVEDKEGNLWIATQIGLNKMNKDHKTFTRYEHDEYDETTLSSNFIYSMTMDSENILWLATIGGGISKLDLNQSKISLSRHHAFDNNSISSNKVGAICEDQKGILWLGTIGGGLNAWDKRDGRFTHYRRNLADTSGLQMDTISAIIEDNVGNLWLGGGQGRIAILSKFDQDRKRMKNFYFNFGFSNVNKNPVLSLYLDHSGILWVGTTNGIIRFEREKESWINYPHDPKKPAGISDFWCNTICEDRRGNLWIGPNSNSLNKLDPRTGKFSHYLHDEHDPTTISSTIVKHIFKDSKGTLWFATRHGGLCRLNEANETFTTFSKKDGLPSNTLYSILEDDDGDLWITTNKGLSRFSPSKLTFTNYDESDGLQSNQFEVQAENAGASFKGRDGTLYFGGPNGFNAFNPRNLRSNPNPPPIVITQFRLFDKLVPGKNEFEEITLDYKENFFSFEFAALNYSNSSQNEYAYQLKGIDKNWVYSGSRRTATYTNIAPGTYTFMVKASNNDGVWNEKGISLKLVITPPWWRTWWFYLICSFAFAGLVYSLVRVYTRGKLQKQRVIFERKQAVELERMRISSDLHDDVGGELSAIRLLSEMNVSNTNPQQQLSKISLSSGELVKKLNEIVWALNMNNDNLQSLIAYIRRYTVKYLDDVGIECHFNHPDEIIDLFIEGNTRRNIFLLVKESLNNIIKHAAASEVTINIIFNENLHISINDNGRGFSGDLMSMSNGNGLRNMQQRANDLGGTFEIKNGQGTTIIFKLPVFTNTKV